MNKPELKIWGVWVGWVCVLNAAAVYFYREHQISRDDLRIFLAVTEMSVQETKHSTSSGAQSQQLGIEVKLNKKGTFEVQAKLSSENPQIVQVGNEGVVTFPVGTTGQTVPIKVNWSRVKKKMQVKLTLSEPTPELVRVGASAVILTLEPAPPEVGSPTFVAELRAPRRAYKRTDNVIEFEVHLDKPASKPMQVRYSLHPAGNQELFGIDRRNGTVEVSKGPNPRAVIPIPIRSSSNPARGTLTVRLEPSSGIQIGDPAEQQVEVAGVEALSITSTYETLKEHVDKTCTFTVQLPSGIQQSQVNVRVRFSGAVAAELKDNSEQVFRLAPGGKKSIPVELNYSDRLLPDRRELVVTATIEDRSVPIPGASKTVKVVADDSGKDVLVVIPVTTEFLRAQEMAANGMPSELAQAFDKDLKKISTRFVGGNVLLVGRADGKWQRWNPETQVDRKIAFPEKEVLGPALKASFENISELVRATKARRRKEDLTTFVVWMSDKSPQALTQLSPGNADPGTVPTGEEIYCIWHGAPRTADPNLERIFPGKTKRGLPRVYGLPRGQSPFGLIPRILSRPR